MVVSAMAIVVAMWAAVLVMSAVVTVVLAMLAMVVVVAMWAVAVELEEVAAAATLALAAANITCSLGSPESLFNLRAGVPSAVLAGGARTSGRSAGTVPSIDAALDFSRNPFVGAFVCGVVRKLPKEMDAAFVRVVAGCVGVGTPPPTPPLHTHA